MIVRALRLRNFRSFRAADLTFSEGQNYVFGGNWQGKSSIVEGIGFALFGREVLPRKLAGTVVKAEHLLRTRAEQGSVMLSFALDDSEYALERSLPLSRVTLKRNGKEVASGSRRVDEALTEILELDAKLFQSIFYSDQDDLRRSLDLAPEQRRQFIERLLGQEVWRERFEGLRKTARHLEHFLDDLATGRFGAFVSQLDELTEAIEQRAERIDELECEIKELKKDFPGDRRDLRRRVADLEANIATLEAQQEKLGDRHDGLKDIIEKLDEGTCPTCTQPVPPKLRLTRTRDLRRALKEMAGRLRQIARELDGLRKKYEAADFDELEGRLDELAALQSEHSFLAEEHKVQVTAERRLRKQARVFGKKPVQRSRAQAELDFLERLMEVVQAHRAGLRGRSLEQLRRAMNDFLARFHDGDNDAEALIDADFSLSVRLHGHDVPLTNMSGAAKDIFALALRYGLMRLAARKIDVLILDEPTRHMDAENVQRFKAQLDELSDRQVILVTVHEEFRDARGRRFVVAKDDDLCSTVAPA